MNTLNVLNHARGTICVVRYIDGQPVALKIADDWKRYSGAFSLI